MTSLDRPVVPDVGMSTARSAGLTVSPGTPMASSLRAGVPRAGAASSRGGPASPLAGPAELAWAQSPASSPASRTPSGSRPAVPAWLTRAASPASVISARGRVCWARPASSAGALRGLAETTTAPSAVRASQQIRYSGVVRAVTITRSPCPIPASRRPRAAFVTWPSAPAKLSVPSSLRTQMPSGSRAAASARTCGMVRLGTDSARASRAASDSSGRPSSGPVPCGPGPGPFRCRPPSPGRAFPATVRLTGGPRDRARNAAGEAQRRAGLVDGQQSCRTPATSRVS